ncbi:HAMP domain-containing sensor histidine kinase, partial [Romboutsia ilealis]|uniref:sensor histidine kinase n=1 Tax=Romboutsia ilealis TaxID=1115758 RepID=UPI002ED3021A
GELDIKLKSNKIIIFKYMIVSVFEVIISLILNMIVYSTIYNFIYYIYVNYHTPLLNKIFKLISYLNYNVFNGNIYFIIGLITFLLIYTAITYKKFSSLSQISHDLELMSRGELDSRIKVKSKGDIGQAADNINEIVKKLKNITIEERNAQQTKTDLITNVSHDLRTPLTSIIGYLNLIEDGKYKDEVELMYYINIAHEKSLNLKALINDLFDLTKMQNKTQTINKQNLDLIELIKQLISQLSIQFKECNMEYRLEFEVDKLMINVDPMMLVRAFENLITNAMRYGNKGHYIDIIVNKEGDKAIIQFINYGEPIPIVDLPYIFDRFYRVEKSRNSYDGGSGLGLAITKNIIETHGGEISVSSDSNNTTFEVKLPLF